MYQNRRLIESKKVGKRGNKVCVTTHKSELNTAIFYGNPTYIASFIDQYQCKWHNNAEEQDIHPIKHFILNIHCIDL